MKNESLRPRAALFRGMAFFVAVGLASMLAVSFAAQRPLEPTVGEFSIEFDTAKLFAVNQRGAAMEINIAPDRVLTLSHERVLSGGDGARTWVGQAKELSGEFSDGTAYITELQGHVYGTISTGATMYELVGRPGAAIVVRDLAAKGLQRKISLRNDAVIPPLLGPRVEVPALGSDRLKALPTPQVTIDVMIVYTTAFTSRYGAGSGVTTRLNNLVAQANDSYVRSEVAITLRLVRAEETGYANTGDNEIALSAIADGTGTFSTLGASRNTYGADLVVLLRPLQDSGTQLSNGSCPNANDHCGCGVAYVGGQNQTAFNSAYGYSVVSEGAALEGSGYRCVDKTLQHELGHNMGLMHDRANVPSGQTGATPYAFGYIVPGTSVGDIMSYAQTPVTCFSSPNVWRQGPVSGLSGGNCNVTPTTGDVLGVAAANAASSADAAATLNFTRQTVAAFRSAATVAISGAVMNGGSPLSGVTFCARPSVGVTCIASSASGAYSCTVPNGWTGTLHAPGPAGLRIKPQFFSSGVSANLSSQNPVVQTIGTCNLDADNNGVIEAATDGVAILRRLLGFPSGAFSGLAGTCAANTTATAIFNATASNFNVSGGSGSAALAPKDGLAIMRAMEGRSGLDVTNGLGLAVNWAQIQSWLNNTCGGSF